MHKEWGGKRREAEQAAKEGGVKKERPDRQQTNEKSSKNESSKEAEMARGEMSSRP